jgi:hypothetical protein
MRVIKSADARNVLPFPARHVEPLLIDRIAEFNRRQLQKRYERNRTIARLSAMYATALVMGVVAAYVGYWLGGL